MTQRPKKNLQYLLDKQELIEQELQTIHEGKETLIVMGFGIMSKEQALALKKKQQKMLALLRVWTADEVQQAGLLLRSRMCKLCQRAYHYDEQPKCTADYDRFVSAIMFKRTLAA